MWLRGPLGLPSHARPPSRSPPSPGVPSCSRASTHPHPPASRLCSGPAPTGLPSTACCRSSLRSSSRKPEQQPLGPSPSVAGRDRIVGTRVCGVRWSVACGGRFLQHLSHPATLPSREGDAPQFNYHQRGCETFRQCMCQSLWRLRGNFVFFCSHPETPLVMGVVGGNNDSLSLFVSYRREDTSHGYHVEDSLPKCTGASSRCVVCKRFGSHYISYYTTSA